MTAPLWILLAFAVLAILPTVATILGVAAFTVGVILFGF